MQKQVTAIHIQCGKEMMAISDGYYFRCAECDTPPLNRGDRLNVRLVREQTAVVDNAEAVA